MVAGAAPEKLIAEGKPAEALAALQATVRDKPDDAKLRVFLFQLLCVLGDWKRAATQLELCGQLDAGALAMVATYRDALACEPLREAVFAGKTTPIVFGQPQPWIATLVEALQADARGETALATRLRSDAFEAAPATPGTLDGQRFEWLADADSRLGPVLEAIVNGRYSWIPYVALAKVGFEVPEDLRDLVWAPAQLEFANGGVAVALVPVRYAGTTESGQGDLLLSRRTEWIELGEQQFRGIGQRLLATDGAEVGLLEAREIVFG